MSLFSKIFGKKEPAQPAPAQKAEDLSQEKTHRDAWESVGWVPQEMAPGEGLVLYNSADRPTFLDVREAHELETEGYIPGSIHIPTGELPTRYGELKPGKPVIVYCASGMRSMDAGAFLLEKGFESVSNLNGGMSLWSGPREGRK